MSEIGYFSFEELLYKGTMIYHRPDGTEVEITNTERPPHRDRVEVGSVTTFVRKGRPPANRLCY